MSENTIKRAGIKGAWRVYKLYYQTSKWAVLLCFPRAILLAAGPYIPLWATARILDGLVNQAPFGDLLTIAIIGVLGGFVLNRLEDAISRVQTVHNDMAVRKMYIERAEKYMTLDFQLLESPKIHEINERIRRDNNWGAGFWSLSPWLKTLLDAIFKFAIGIGVLVPMLVRYSVQGSILFIAGLLLFSWLISWVSSNIFGKKTTDLLNDPKIFKPTAASHLVWNTQISQLLKTARIYNMSAIVEPSLMETEKENRDFVTRFTKLTIGTGLTSSLASGVLSVASYLFIVARAVAGAITVGNILLLTGAIYNMAKGFLELATNVHEMFNQTDRIQSMLDFMEMPTTMEKGTLPVEKRLDNEYEIEFKDVSFKYPGHENYVLQNFNMKLNIGQKLAIVGLNGSGKTTMIKLLCRLYDPTQGEITLNGIDIKKYSYQEYMGIFSVVFQDFNLLSFTLGENLACSTTIEPEVATKILEDVGFGQKLALGDYLYNNFAPGVEISGGEAQKIALARALYKNAPFILLDEPTAALDPIAEHEIYANFNKLTTDRTAIFISHRLSSCRFCDDIAVFSQGRLVQRGNHDTLVAQEGGVYQKLWNAQAQYYEA